MMPLKMKQTPLQDEQDSNPPCKKGVQNKSRRGEEPESSRLKISMMLLSDELSQEVEVSYENLIYKENASNVKKMKAKLSKALEDIGPWEPSKSNKLMELKSSNDAHFSPNFRNKFQKPQKTGMSFSLEHRERPKLNTRQDPPEFLASESKNFVTESNDSFIMGQPFRINTGVQNTSSTSGSFTRYPKNQSIQSTSYTKFLDNESHDCICEISCSKQNSKSPVINYPLQSSVLTEGTKTENAIQFRRSTLPHFYQKNKTQSTNFMKFKRPASCSSTKNMHHAKRSHGKPMQTLPSSPTSKLSKYCHIPCDKTEFNIIKTYKPEENTDHQFAFLPQKELNQMNQQHQEPKKESQIEFKTLFQNFAHNTYAGTKSSTNQLATNSNDDDCSYVGLSMMKRTQYWRFSETGGMERQSKSPQQSQAIYTFPIIEDTPEKRTNGSGKQALTTTKQMTKQMLTPNYRPRTQQSQSTDQKPKQLKAVDDKSVVGAQEESITPSLQTPSNPVASRALQEIQSMIEMLEKKPNKSIANTYLLAFAQKQYRKLSRPSTSSSTSIKQPKISKFLVDGSIIDKHEMRPLTQQKLRRRVSLNE